MRRFLRSLTRRPAAVGVTAWIGLFLLSLAWVFATPLSASPDEASHIIKAAAVVRGELTGEPTDDPSVRTVQVPAGIAEAQNWHCFAFKPNVSAACAPTYGDGQGLQPAVTSAALYNPVFYAIVGWPTLLPISAEAAVYVMRLVNAALTSAFLAVAMVILTRLGRPRVVALAGLAALTPMVFFLNASVNPNAIEVSAGALSVAALFSVTRRPPSGRNLWAILAVAAAAAAIMVNVRSIAALWLALFIAIVLATAPRGHVLGLLKRWPTWLYVVAVAVATAGAGAWILGTNTLSNMGVFPGAGTVTPLRGFITMLFDRSFDPGLVGIFGWLDTSGPNYAFALWSFLGFAVVIAAAVVVRRREFTALVGFIAVFLLAPPVIQAASVMNSGYIWQGRYTLVALVALVFFAAAALATSSPGSVQLAAAPQRRLLIIVGALFVFGHATTLLVATRRYMLGAEANWIDAIVHPQWMPPVGTAIWIVVATIGAAAVFCAPLLGLRAQVDGPERVPARS
jgi:hypothetical protein